LKLTGISAIVTGGASGLGAATARKLAHAGAKVAVFDLNKDLAETVAKEIGGVAIACDVSNGPAAEAGIAAAREKHGVARVLINCAGIGLGKRIVGKDGPMPLEDYTKVIQVNLIGTFNMLRLAATEMSKLDPIGEERGVIVNTASIAAYEGQVGQAAYASSKGGIVALTMPASRELSQFGIRVNTIAPGIMLTPLLMKLPEEVQKSLGESVLFPKRLGQASEFASLVQHIVENEYINGETIRIDGGLRMAPR
jgi:NAD(P)-dependent dehydrogenase (short-subunit alcohol dehydrogenase family)